MMFRVHEKCPQFSTAGFVLHFACDTGQAETFVISRQLTGQKQQVHGRAYFAKSIGEQDCFNEPLDSVAIPIAEGSGKHQTA
jgi:hypothetical protein